MKIFKITLIGLTVFLVLTIIAGYWYLISTKPTYKGSIELEGINDNIEIYFDDFGVPHIYAQNEEDAYYALGFVHAQERLFQMELISRVASGKLSEVLGKELIETDKLFRSLNLEGKAIELANFAVKNNLSHVKSTNAYFNGINAFVETGHTPIEFRILGIPKREYTIKDAYLTAGVLAFGFAEGFRVDPIIAKIESELGDNYLNDLSMYYTPGTEKIPVKNNIDSTGVMLTSLHTAINNIPIALWNGSNSWILGGSKTKSGHVILENDTHIGFSQPAVWYEAHIEYPGHSFYGNHAAMIPFGVLGRNNFGAWGITMFENDDVDFFREKLNPENLNQYKDGDNWKPLLLRKEVIKVKGEEDIFMEVAETVRGPIINEVFKNLPNEKNNHPISVWWAFRDVQNDFLQTVYNMDHHSNMDEMKLAVSQIEAPGLNIMYANVNDEMAWWAAAKLPKRNRDMNPQTINNAFDKAPFLGHYDFSENPHNENPENSYLYSANNQPDTIAGILYPGYYVPEDRAKRIVSLLESKDDWTAQEVQNMTMDDYSPNHLKIVNELLIVLNPEIKGKKNEEILKVIADWKGDHEKATIAPTLYYQLLSQIIHDAMADELGQDVYNEFKSTHVMKRTYYNLINNDSSVWWDDVNTNKIETRKDIIVKAYYHSVSTLENRYGTNTDEWNWGNAHTLEHPHAIGKVKPMDKIFNVGPFSVSGGMQVINNLMFPLSTDGTFKTTGGAAVRSVIELNDIGHGYTILPTGQSGNFMSPHYDDQALMFANGQFRKTTMVKEEILSSEMKKLNLIPKK